MGVLANSFEEGILSLKSVGGAYVFERLDSVGFVESFNDRWCLAFQSSTKQSSTTRAQSKHVTGLHNSRFGLDTLTGTPPRTQREAKSPSGHLYVSHRDEA